MAMSEGRWQNDINALNLVLVGNECSVMVSY